MKTFLLLILSLFAVTGYAQNFSLSFDGQSEYIQFPHNDDYNINTSFTIEAWIQADQWRSTSWQGTIISSDIHPSGQPNQGFAFRCGDNGTLSFVTATNGTWEEALTGPVMNLNQWHHVAVTVNSGTITLYIDGVSLATHVFATTPTDSSNLPVNIGESPGFPGRHFSGNIDEVRIWSTSRTEAEIKDNMTKDLTGMEDDLVAYFPMNEGQGTVTNDLTSTGASAVFNNMDDSNWVGGYTLPDFDISVQNVYGVDVLNMIDRPVKVRTDILNTGTMDVSDVDLSLLINGELHHTETIAAVISPGEFLEYQFNIPIDLIGMVDPEITVEASLVDDGNVANNTGTLNVKSGSRTNAIIADDVFHNLGQQGNILTTTLPNDLHKYEQILLNIDLSCPSGGCGDWDVVSDLRLLTDDGSYEIARYVTPYGIACGGWQVDITDFKSILGGDVRFATNILVYTQTGWLVDMSIDLIDNNDEDTYSDLTRLWENRYQVYGDPNISYDLEALPVTFKDNTEASHVRIVLTGHGQGNTNNAAEFFETNHELVVNDIDFHTHNLWKADCPSNPCSNQLGTWLFPRSGWCPGQEVTPYIINLGAAVAGGQTIELDYEFQEYNNQLNTGYNNNGHTEPHYIMSSYLVETSTTPYKDYNNLKANTVVADINNANVQSATVTFENDGFSTVDGYRINLYHDKELIATEDFSESIATGTIAEKDIALNLTVDTSAPNSIFAEVIAATDQNSGDNIVKQTLSTNTADIIADYNFEMFPNPSDDGNVTLNYDSYWSGSLFQIYTLDGKLIKTITIAGTSQIIELPNEGTFFTSLIHNSGLTVTPGKIVFVK